MILTAIIDGEAHNLDVPDALIVEGEDFFIKLDADMDRGWQMSRDWVQHPDRMQRCRIVADKLLSAMETGNRKLGLLMAGYILSRMPGVDRVEIDIQGEMQNTAFGFKEQVAVAAPPEVSDAPAGRSKLEAMEQAGNDVTKVFKVGKGYRFSVFDHATAEWKDSPLIAGQQEAERLRQEAFKARFEALQRGGN